MQSASGCTRWAVGCYEPHLNPVGPPGHLPEVVLYGADLEGAERALPLLAGEGAVVRAAEVYLMRVQTTAERLDVIRRLQRRRHHEVLLEQVLPVQQVREVQVVAGDLAAHLLRISLFVYIDYLNLVWKRHVGYVDWAVRELGNRQNARCRLNLIVGRPDQLHLLDAVVLLQSSLDNLVVLTMHHRYGLVGWNLLHHVEQI